ncbi:MAG: hypothetical protein KAS66_11965 [Candidatus Omnitrophica bacterium]|nr:hypothetical protein [Candidatus Omnitrophota bacterium]
MKKLKIVIFFLIFMCCSVVVFAVKAKDIPPWMEDIEDSGRSTYLIPKGAKRKVVGSQVIIETPNEYVARRLYEMEEYLRERFKEIEENQGEFQRELDELKKSIRRIEKDHRFTEDFEKLKRDVDELNKFKANLEESELPEEPIEEPDAADEIVEDPEEIVEEESR